MTRIGFVQTICETPVTILPYKLHSTPCEWHLHLKHSGWVLTDPHRASVLAPDNNVHCHLRCLWL